MAGFQFKLKFHPIKFEVGTNAFGQSVESWTLSRYAGEIPTFSGYYWDGCSYVNRIGHRMHHVAPN